MYVHVVACSNEHQLNLGTVLLGVPRWKGPRQHAALAVSQIIMLIILLLVIPKHADTK